MYSRLTDTGNATRRIFLKVLGGAAAILVISAAVRGTGGSSDPPTHYYSPVQNTQPSTPTPPVATVEANPARFSLPPVDVPPVQTVQRIAAAPVAVREPDYVYERRYEPPRPAEQPYYPEIYSVHTRYRRTYDPPTDSAEDSPPPPRYKRERPAEATPERDTTAPPKYIRKAPPPRPTRSDPPTDHSRSSDRDPKHDSRR
jgi:hypothetical protein